MLFSSISFLIVFLPIMLLLYYLTPCKYKNLTLFIGSLAFYFAGEPKYTVLLLFSTLVDYSHSLIIVNNRGTKVAKAALISSIVINLSMLGFFKYSDFLIANINTLFNSHIELLGLSLPIGISFFTFQTMSYTIDIYRNDAEIQKSPLGLGTYVALFPQLIAGPIVRYKTIAKQLVSRTHSIDDFSYGIHRFTLGLAKKVIVANSLGELAVMINTTTDSSVVFYWMSAIAFSLQIYFDFSGYSDMAIGLGRMFGFHFLENFNYPYISKSISEFWTRWHMSLSQWFRDYVYIPLGGNRKGKLYWFRNILIVWMLTGIWHGASWNFVAWGLYLGLFIVIEKLVLLKALNKLPQALQHLYVIFVILMSFVIFNNDTLTKVVHYFKGMFGLLDIPLHSIESTYYLKSYMVVFIIAFIGATPMVKIMTGKLLSSRIHLFVKGSAPLLYVTILLVITGYLVDSSFNPFLYFRF